MAHAPKQPHGETRQRDLEAELARLRQDLRTERTRRRKAEAELRDRELQARQVETRLADIVEAFPGAVVVYDAGSKITTANRAFKDLYPSQTDVLVPGTDLETFVRTGLERGAYPQAKGGSPSGFGNAWITSTASARSLVSAWCAVAAAGSRSGNGGPGTAASSACGWT